MTNANIKIIHNIKIIMFVFCTFKTLYTVAIQNNQKHNIVYLVLGRILCVSKIRDKRFYSPRNLERTKRQEVQVYLH